MVEPLTWVIHFPKLFQRQTGNPSDRTWNNRAAIYGGIRYLTIL